MAEGYSFVIPKDWIVTEEIAEDGIYCLSILPSKEAYSTITIELQKDEELNATTASLMQTLIAQMYTEEYVTSLAQEEWENAIISNYTLSTLKNNLGSITKVYYDMSVTENDVTMDANIATYFTVTEDCMISVLGMVTPIEKITDPTVLEVADYIAQSFTKQETATQDKTNSETQTVTAGPFTFSAPKDWLASVIPMDGAYLCGIRPTGANASNVIVTIEKFKDEVPSWDELKKELTSIDEDTMSQSLNSTQTVNGDTLTLTAFTTEDITFDIGPAYKISYTVEGTTNGKAYSTTQTQYVLLVNNYAILIAGTSYDYENITEPTILEAAEMIVQTLKVK